MRAQANPTCAPKEGQEGVLAVMKTGCLSQQRKASPSLGTQDLGPRADYTPVIKASQFPGDAHYLLLSVRLRTSPWGSLHLPISFFFSFSLTQTLCRMSFEIDCGLDDKQSLRH